MSVHAFNCLLFLLITGTFTIKQAHFNFWHSIECMDIHMHAQSTVTVTGNDVEHVPAHTHAHTHTIIALKLYTAA